ncbi:MAG: serine hydrolase [Bacteroidota bacterium]
MRIFKYVVLILLAIAGLAVFMITGISEGFLLRSIAADDSPKAFAVAAEALAKQEFVGNLALTIVHDGEVVENYFYSKDQQIDEYTIYQMASVSKWVTAWGVFSLVQKGKLDLDKPVDDYLMRWHLPASEYDNNKVTARKLLSHTSGLVDGLGYLGFPNGENIQTLEESLTMAADAIYSEGIAKVGYEPGSRYQYSGGGYTLLQLLIEEISGQSFQEYMTKEVLLPLGMEHSTFVLTDRLNWQIATLYNKDGSISEPYVYTALAAASLYSCTNDMAKFLKAHVTENAVLSKESLKEMTTSTAFRNQIGIHGLGPHLFSGSDENSQVIGHNGSNLKPQINTTARIDLIDGNGIVVMEMGNESLATVIGDEWLFQQAGIADFVVIQRNKNSLIIFFVAGLIIIIGIGVYLFRKRDRKSQRSIT